MSKMHLVDFPGYVQDFFSKRIPYVILLRMVYATGLLVKSILCSSMMFKVSMLSLPTPPEFARQRGRENYHPS